MGSETLFERARLALIGCMVVDDESVFTNECGADLVVDTEKSDDVADGEEAEEEDKRSP